MRKPSTSSFFILRSILMSERYQNISQNDDSEKISNFSQIVSTIEKISQWIAVCAGDQGYPLLLCIQGHRTEFLFHEYSKVFPSQMKKNSENVNITWLCGIFLSVYLFFDWMLNIELYFIVGNHKKKKILEVILRKYVFCNLKLFVLHHK